MTFTLNDTTVAMLILFAIALLLLLAAASVGFYFLGRKHGHQEEPEERTFVVEPPVDTSEILTVVQLEASARIDAETALELVEGGALVRTLTEERDQALEKARHEAELKATYRKRLRAQQAAWRGAWKDRIADIVDSVAVTA